MQESSCKNANKRIMVMPHNFYNNYESQLLLSSASSSCCEKTGRSDFGFDIGGGGGGSMFCNTSNQVDCMSDIYDVVGASGSGSCTNNSAAAVLVSKSLSRSSISDSFFHFNSSSGEMAAASVNVNVRVPFTATQLQELERQTLIYKCMLASAPIPNELLLSITKRRSKVPSYQPNMVQGSTELRFLSYNNSDAEPWRCRRTDGKKWRCSRDVASEQKYCERHSHKSRHRSRKPVELQAHRINNKNQSVNILNKSYAKSHFLNQNMASSIASSEQKQPSDGAWNGSMKGRQCMMLVTPTTKNGSKTPASIVIIIENISSTQIHTPIWVVIIVHSKLSGYLINTVCFLDQNWFPIRQNHETRHFIDAWSIKGGNMPNENRIGSNCFVSQDEKLPLSSLTLSMSGGSETIERNEKVLMGSLGTMGLERKCAGTLRPHWMNHDSGMSSPPGGPLAEALCLGIGSSGAK